MNDRRQIAEATARKYTRSQELLKPLGSVAKGFIFPTNGATAIKVFTYREKYQFVANERLGDCNADEIIGFAIPRFINADLQLLVIEMSKVEPAFFLDFAQSVLDEPLDFPDGMDE